MEPRAVLRLSAVSVLVALFSSVASAQNPRSEPTTTPILFEAHTQNGKTMVSLNGQVMTVERVGEWLAQMEKEFGGDDPVVVRFDADAALGTVLKLRDVAARTHKNLRLVFDQKGDGAAPLEVSFSEISPKLLVAPQ